MHRTIALTKAQQKMIADVREMSPLVAQYVERRFNEGASSKDVWNDLELMRNRIDPEPKPSSEQVSEYQGLLDGSEESNQ